MSGAHFFKADTIIHYRIEIEEEALSSLVYNENKTETEELKIKVLFDEKHPARIKQTQFIGKLENLGFTKTKVEQAKLVQIQSIFKLKDISSTEQSYCGAVFRDVLVFHQKHEIVGIAKLCFSCGHHVIAGTSVNTKYFGQQGDYEVLHNLLNH